MSKSLCGRWPLLVLVAPLAALPGCQACSAPPNVLPPQPCASPTLENFVEAGPVARAAGIIEYGYRADLEETALSLILRDEAGGEEEMEIAQVFDEGGLAPGTMRATLGQTELTTRGRTRPDGVEQVSAVLHRGEDTLRLEIDLRLLPCFDEEGPQCAGALDPTNEHVLLPTCGLKYDGHLRAGRAPVVVGLRYLLPASDAEGAGSGLARVDGDAFEVVDLFADGMPRPAVDVADDIDAVGGPLPDILADPEVRKLAAAYFDRSWARELELHAATCLAEGAFDIVEPAEEASALTEGTNANRDGNAWDDGGGSSGGRAWGDPHLVTFDDVSYDFQAQGEFLLASSTPEELEPLVVHTRFAPREGGPAVCREVSITTAAAALVDGRVYEVGGGALLVDGAAATTDELGEGVSFTGGTLSITSADGTVILIEGISFLNVTISPSAARAATFTGLLGDFDGDAENDFRLAPGADPLDRPVPFEVLYGAYRDAWRLDEESSLFTHEGGAGPDDFYDPSMPSSPARLDLIEESLLAPAEEACRAQGLTASNALFDCVLDAICETEGPAPPATRAGADRDQGAIHLQGDLAAAPRPATFDPGASADPDPDACRFDEAATVLVYDEGERSLDDVLLLDQVAAERVSSPDAATPGEVPAGASVRTWLLHLPPQSEEGVASGTLRFAHPVAGLLFTDEGVADLRFVPDGQSVVETSARGLTLAEGTAFAISEDRREVEVTLLTRSDAEQVRVVLEVTP